MQQQAIRVKKCSTCKEDKPLSEFHVCNRTKDKRQSSCKPCAILKMQQYQRKNREKVNAKNRKWKSENKPWLSDNAKADVRNRYAKRKSHTPRWADEQWIKDYYEGAIHLQLQVDHIVPINSPIVCGLHCEHNLQLLPADVNNEKGNRYWPNMPEGY